MKVTLWMRVKYLYRKYVSGCGSTLGMLRCSMGIHDMSYTRQVSAKGLPGYKVNELCRHCHLVGKDITGVY